MVVPEATSTPDRCAGSSRVVLVACGTSYHAALVGRFMIERLAGLPAEVDLASEFRYRDASWARTPWSWRVSQSGETADTLGAVEGRAASRARRSLAITNVVGSAMAREAAGVIYTHAGPEIGVASTKTFTTTITACYLLGARARPGRGFLTESTARKRIAASSWRSRRS